MARIDELIGPAKSIAIAGHLHPDGDCIGSCMGLYLYLKKNRPELSIDIFLEKPRDVFSYISCISDAKTEDLPDKVYDCYISLDTSSEDRIGVATESFKKAKRRVCIDHHITNPGLGDENVIEATASSASEVLYGLLDPEALDLSIATALYTGIIHDCGVFQYSNTGKKTLEIAAKLIAMGIDFPTIIDKSFYERTYEQSRILGHVLEHSRRYMKDQVCVGLVYPEDYKTFGIGKNDLDSIVSQLRLIKGVEVAVFLYPAKEGMFKVSLRASGHVDVSAVATVFGGGGHVKAAGCSLEGDPEEIIEKLLAEIKKQL